MRGDCSFKKLLSESQAKERQNVMIVPILSEGEHMAKDLKICI